MNVLAYLKSANLTEGAEDNEWKLDLRISKDLLLCDVDAMQEMVMLQGGGVRLVLAAEYNPSFESKKEKKAREEREKYDKVMEDKRRHEAEAQMLPLDDCQPEGITLPPVDIIKIGDYQDTRGNRFVVERDLHVANNEGDETIEYWQIRVTPADDEADLSGIAMEDEEYGTEPEAREALKTWAEARGYTMVAPEGWGTVYQSTCPGYVYRVAPHDGGFTLYSHKIDGSDACELLDEFHVHPTPAEAQEEADKSLQADNYKVFGFIDLASIVVPVEDEPASPAMVYEDGEGNRYWVEVFDNNFEPTEAVPEPRFVVLKCEKAPEDVQAEVEPTLFEEITPKPVSQVIAQGRLNAHAKMNDWKPVTVPELLAEVAGEAEQAPLSQTVTVGRWIIFAAAQTITPEAQRVTSIDPGKGSLDTNKRLAPLSFADLDAYWRLATEEEIAAASYDPLAVEASPVDEAPAEQTLSDLASQEAANLAQANPEPAVEVPDVFENTSDKLFSDVGDLPGVTRCGPAPSSYIRIGDSIAPMQPNKITGAISNTPKKVSKVDRRPGGSVYADGYGTIFFAQLDADWRLVFSLDTISPGDELENGKMSAIVDKTDHLACWLRDSEKPTSKAFQVPWADLSMRWSMKKRSEPVTATAGAAAE